MPRPNIRIRAPTIITPRDPRALRRSAAIPIRVQRGCRIRVIVCGLIEVDARGAEAVVAVSPAAEIVRVGVVAAAVGSFAEMGAVGAAAALEGGGRVAASGSVGKGVRNVDKGYWGFGIADCEVGVGAWGWDWGGSQI